MTSWCFFSHKARRIVMDSILHEDASDPSCRWVKVTQQSRASKTAVGQVSDYKVILMIESDCQDETRRVVPRSRLSVLHFYVPTLAPILM